MIKKSEWVKINEDEPLLKRGKHISVAVDVLLNDYTIKHDCFYGYAQRVFYDENGIKIPKADVYGWRTA